MARQSQLKEAVLWDKAQDSKVNCFLCAHRCTIGEGKTGFCGVRENIDGVLYSLVYDKVCSANADPIEKKPLFHFQPGSKSFSIATPGCNFRCTFCQNWQISQMAREEGSIEGSAYSPEDIVKAAVSSGCKSIAYTYTEPTIFMELCGQCGKLARENGLCNVFVSNGYETKEAIDFARPWLDGINIDLKAFSEDFYKSFCKAKLGPVLDTIKYIANHTDIWMEITTLIVPGENDSPEELRDIAEFISKEASADVPWHVSRFHPTYEMNTKPVTPEDSLEMALNIGKQAGLRYVYVGNLPGSRAESTFCYSCSELLIERVGYRIVKNNIKDGDCPACGAQIAGFGLD